MTHHIYSRIPVHCRKNFSNIMNRMLYASQLVYGYLIDQLKDAFLNPPRTATVMLKLYTFTPCQL